MAGPVEKKIDVLNRRLKDFADAYTEFQKIGISDEILLAYVMYKTKLSQKSIKAVMATQDEFYKLLVNNLMLENLEDEDNG